ncbi:hypothetical protein [Streptomyces sp. MJM1172]|uniref:hypothetical protein n=1 Tax=Streptomyces sp. MJM1172 TaxID=1703926 RepID=UPI001161012F|nr:hypothetical protein [Streptomyces sp. MJM1172]
MAGRGPAGCRFAVTRNEYGNAQIQARAVAALLRDAETLFTELRGKAEAAVAEAVAAGMKVSEGGNASFDFSKADAATANAARHDPGLAEVERSWTHRIQQAVDAFEEADHGVKLALVDAVTDTNLNDGTFGGFNGSRPYPSPAAAVKAQNMPKDRAKVADWWRSLVEEGGAGRLQEVRRCAGVDPGGDIPKPGRASAAVPGPRSFPVRVCVRVCIDHHHPVGAHPEQHRRRLWNMTTAELPASFFRTAGEGGQAGSIRSESPEVDPICSSSTFEEFLHAMSVIPFEPGRRPGRTAPSAPALPEGLGGRSRV